MNEKIHSLGVNTEFRKIFACLEEEKSIKFFNYDIEKKFIKLMGKISNTKDSDGKFNRCFQISGDNMVTNEKGKLTLWKLTFVFENSKFVKKKFYF